MSMWLARRAVRAGGCTGAGWAPSYSNAITDAE